jgi:hypothetical protein
MRYKLTFTFLLLFFALPASAANIYVASASAGANNGSNCANARIYTSLVAGDYVADNFIHLCGTITLAANTTAFTVLGSGTSGHPITILFETGAVLTAPYWPLGTGAINCNSHAFITIDGGSNGLITASANGDVLANQQNSDTINGASTGCSNFTVQNMHISNIYVKVEGNNSAGAGDTTIGIHIQGSNALVQNNTLDHMRYPIYVIYTATATSNLEIKNNTVTFGEACMVAGDGQSNSSLTGLKIHDNDCGGGNYLWDSDSTTLNNFHHNCFHTWATQPGSLFTGLQIYNNYCHGIMGRDSVYAGAHGGGTHITAVIFLETVGDGALIFNNVISLSGSFNYSANGHIYCKSSATPTESCRNASFYNNTIIGVGNNCAELDSTGAIWKNNICSGIAYAIYPPNNGAYTNTVIADYDDYYQATSFGRFDSWTGWKTAGEDTHGSQANPNLDAVTFVPNVGSPIISTGVNPGVNLTSLGIAALNADKNGGGRPATGNWTMGALNFSSVVPATPTGVTVVWF